MAVRRLLTWDKSRRRWKKKYRGKQHYFAFGDSKTDVEGYRLAAEAWGDLKKTLDGKHDEETQQAVEQRERVLNWYSEGAMVEGSRPENEKWDYMLREAIAGELIRLQENREQTRPLSLAQLNIAVDALWGEPDDVRAVWRNRLPSLGETWKAPSYNGRSVGSSVQTYKLTQRAKAKSGQLSTAYIQTLETHLAHVRNFLGEATSATQINGHTFTSYHAHLLGQIAKHEITPAYAASLMSILKRFVKWLYATEVIDKLPRILIAGSRDLTFGVTPQSIEVCSIAEIRQLLDAASERTKLFILLMLNTGANQVDISDLRPDDVDWKAGRITRKRSKTAKHENVPTVSYKLWPETLALLKKYRSLSRVHVLLNANGKPLRFREIMSDGRIANLDNVRSAYERLTRKLKIKKPKTLKAFRKTAASKLAEHPEYARFAQHFLGHSPRTIADKHYIRPSDEQFDRAVEWLGQELAIGTAGQAKSKRRKGERSPATQRDLKAPSSPFNRVEPPRRPETIRLKSD